MTPDEAEAEIRACAQAIGMIALSRDNDVRKAAKRKRLHDRIASLRAQLGERDGAA